MRRFVSVLIVIMVITSGCIAGGKGTPTAPESSPAETSHPTNSDVLNPVQTDEAMNVVSASNLFGTELYLKLSGEKGNVLISPFSVFTALAMAYEGARGETAKEMGLVLHLPANDSKRREAFRTLLLNMERLGGIKLTVANALWVQRGYPVRKDYVDVIRRYYLGEARELDFQNDPESAERTINEWVREETNGKIENIVGNLDPLTRLIITNAVYFRANWSSRFRPEDTRNERFTLPSGEKITVPMMHQLGEFNYTETEEVQVLEMPYEDSSFSMVIILPRKMDGLSGVERSLSPAFIGNLLEKLHPENVSVAIPKFEFRESYPLSDVLREMGIRSAFTDNANFSGISEKPIAISDIRHKTFISVAENGTEAAAATAVTFTVVSVREEGQEYKVFRADHPFLFLIVDRESGLVLFIGRLEDPRG